MITENIAKKKRQYEIVRNCSEKQGELELHLKNVLSNIGMLDKTMKSSFGFADIGKFS